MNLLCIVFGIIFMVTGVLFLFGKAPKYIKEWRDMPEKEKIDIKSLCRNVACVFISAAVIFLISGVSQSFKDAAFVWGIIVWLVATGFDIAFISKSKRYYTR